MLEYLVERGLNQAHASVSEMIQGKTTVQPTAPGVKECLNRSFCGNMNELLIYIG